MPASPTARGQSRGAPRPLAALAGTAVVAGQDTAWRETGLLGSSDVTWPAVGTALLAAFGAHGWLAYRRGAGPDEA